MRGGFEERIHNYDDDTWWSPKRRRGRWLESGWWDSWKISLKCRIVFGARVGCDWPAAS